MIVMKFGGTSVENAAAIRRVGEIVASRLRHRPVLVVSAMGKTTDRLVTLAQTAATDRRRTVVDLLNALRDLHSREAAALVSAAARAPLEATLDQHFQELNELVRGLGVLGELTPRSLDTIMSYGERLSALIVTQALEHQGLPAAHVDSRRCVVTDASYTRAAPLPGPTRERLRATIPPLLDRGHVPVMGGFIGATEQGITTTLGRGGSDFSASLIGAALDARRIEIWTDVDGLLTADPALYPGARRVKVISFEEASELAYFGAKVLHPSTLLPAVEKNIPVLVLNSRNPAAGGTLIATRAPRSTNIFKSIACKRNITLVDVASTRMLMAHGFLSGIFQVFAAHQTPVDMVATSEVSVSLTVDDTSRLPAIVSELRKIARVDCQGGQAIVCLVGDNIRFTPGIAGKVFKAIERVNVRMISQGASERNLSFVVEEADLREVVGRLHRVFFGRLDPKTFSRKDAKAQRR